MNLGDIKMNIEKLNQSENDLILVNIIEEMVRDKVRHTINKIDMCKCKICQLNACAIALNALPAKYVTATKGALLAQLAVSNLDSQIDIEVEVVKALKTVKENPLH